MVKTSKSTIESDLIRTLASILEETGLSEIEYGKDGLNIRVVRPVIPPAAALEPALVSNSMPDTRPSSEKLPADELSLIDHPGAVISPMVGVIYTSPDPNSAPFAVPGDLVSEGQTLFLIEAMKVFNPITAPKAGKLTRILVDSEMPVEFGEPLALIE